jgi:subtilase family protein
MKIIPSTYSRTSLYLLLSALSGAAISADTVGAQFADATVKIVHWNSEFQETVRPMDRSTIRTELLRLSVRSSTSHIIVHFNQPLTKDDHSTLAASGLTLQSPLGDNAYFATVNEGINPDAINGVLAVSEITPNHKLHKDLATGVLRSWMVHENAAKGDALLQQMLDGGMAPAQDFLDRNLDPTIAVLVMFHKDEQFQIQSKRLARDLNGKVISEIYSVNTVTMHIPLSRLSELASDDAVQWIEPPLPPMEDVNAENRVLSGADTLNASPYDLDGSGVSVLVYDGGQARPHLDFGTRLTIGASDTDSTSNHATHVAGTIGGAGLVEFANRGMAPGVNLISYGFEVVGGLQPGFLYTDPGDLESDYSEALALYNVDIANNSIGTNIESNGYPCEWTGDYGITSTVIDAIARGSLGAPMRIVWANGNERSRSRCFGDDFGNHGEFYSTAPPATAKNHIAVGSVDSDTDLSSYFSSWGPTDDGRLKPDISAPGCESGDGVGVLSTTVDSSSGASEYSSACGTSMASPTVTGICALILEQYRLTFPDREDPMNATLKALLANTAVDRGNIGPDYAYGYGSIRGVDAVNTVLMRNMIEGEVGQDGVYRFQISAQPGDTELKITIAWDDIPGAPNVGQALVNDLDLQILDSDGNVYLPWTLDPANPSAPAVQTQEDHLNNIEQVLIANPMVGEYMVEVRGTSIADAGTQTFGAVSSTKITDCSSAGVVSISESTVPCGQGQVDIRVTDCDLNLSDQMIESVDVLVSSDTQPAGVMLTLIETEPDSAVFSAAQSYDNIGGSGLQISDGDTVTATYEDQDDGLGVSSIMTAEMTVDCSPPIVTDRYHETWYNHATVHVESEEYVSCRIFYASAGSIPSTIVDSTTTLGMTHTVRIPDLVELSDYVYTIVLTDVVGNITILDGEGSGIPFSTIRGPIAIHEFLVDDTDPGWDRTGDWEFGQPSGLLGNPSEAPTGNSIFGYDLDDWFPWHMQEEYLTTSSLDFSGVYEIRMEFQRWLGMVPDIFNNASIRYRIGEGDWETLWEFRGGRMSPDEWSLVSYDLPSSLNNQSEVQFRWVMGSSEIHITECGWNIDDIVFTGVVPPPPCDVDYNNDGHLNFLDVSAFLTLYGQQSPEADLTGDGSFNFLDVSRFLTLFGNGCP